MPNGGRGLIVPWQMICHCFSPILASCTGALLVLGIGFLWRIEPPPGEAEVRVLLSNLEKECHPESPANAYAWSSNAPPTERHRRELLERLHALKAAAAAEVRCRLQEQRCDEFGEMLVVLAAALGERAMIRPSAMLMAYSDHPAVRLCAARELRKLRDPQTIEWFEYAASQDDRCVRNDGCGRSTELFYPVRAAAVLALKDMGIELSSDERL